MILLTSPMIFYKNNQIMADISGKQQARPPLPLIKVISQVKTPQTSRGERSPHLARTNSQSKNFKRISVEKNPKEKEIEKQLKYAKPSNVQTPLDRSFVRSQNNHVSALFGVHLEDSQQTIQRVKCYSREKNLKGSRRWQQSPKGEVTKAFDMLSGVSGSNVKKGDQYYTYWKSKAHEYLQSNMKLMKDIRQLTQENEEMKEQLQKLRRKTGEQKSVKIQYIQVKQKAVGVEDSNKELRKMSLHYISKIEEMEKELKKKQIAISAYQDKMAELSHKLAGDNERIKIISRMKEEIEKLQEQVNQEKMAKQETTSLHKLSLNSPVKGNIKSVYSGSHSYSNIPSRIPAYSAIGNLNNQFSPKK